MVRASLRRRRDSRRREGEFAAKAPKRQEDFFDLLAGVLLRCRGFFIRPRSSNRRLRAPPKSRWRLGALAANRFSLLSLSAAEQDSLEPDLDAAVLRARPVVL